ncbi:peptidoglycan DD-metalloendopeptidase family protein [Rathayibacter sp. VKM Ac-2857]|uniref:peptidoglycan DD-metalloendopeptidase family protein n=1 Tax=Rathayibacter sp. VKM Ac-2857 TaxID=2739020 RepID=UPI001563EFC7|nr:peptidoglycan DD-metalloendopeptidase family protein [Rathayibacter sp. VKM Ac-2857]NQX15813.1 peptidoglycan DD-metalloendopeptidase family protein [Rathayibacter sp. VKM Ac-2857]
MKRRTVLAALGATVVSASVVSAVPASAADHVGEVAAPADLRNGDQIVSRNGRTRLVMQPDGNAVIYAKDDSALWKSDTDGNSGARLAIQADGGLVIYRATDNSVVKVLRAGGSGAASRRLVMQNDGNLVLLSTSDSALWFSGTETKPIFYTDSIPVGSEMAYGDTLRSPSGQFRLVMQGDGNLAVYTPGNQIVFQSYTSGADCRFVPQADGNLVIYRGSGPSIWQTYSTGTAAKLSLQDDGNIVLYRSDGTAGYRSNTFSAALIAGEALQPGHHLSNNGYKAIMQADGNFVIYDRSNAVQWQTRTSVPGSVASMQSDGNFVIQNGANVRWQASTAGRQGKRVVLETDGRLLMTRDDGVSVWNNVTGTAVPATWQLPFEGTWRVTTEFQVKDSAHPNGHRGLDWGLPQNWPQRAMSDGTVVLATTSDPTYGHRVDIRHADGVVSLLGHLIAGSPIVSVGDRVTKGQVVGYTGNTGVSFGNHCHLTITQNGNLLDPRIFFESRGIAVD